MLCPANILGVLLDCPRVRGVTWSAGTGSHRLPPGLTLARSSLCSCSGGSLSFFDPAALRFSHQPLSPVILSEVPLFFLRAVFARRGTQPKDLSSIDRIAEPSAASVRHTLVQQRL
jgi:hypothetical protein